MIMHNDWDQLFDQEIQKNYLQNLRYFLAKEYKTKNIYPAKENIFAAFKTTSLKDTKVVILGQDPYHGPGQAQGYSFSVPSNFPLPPSLQNMYKELENEYQTPVHRTGDLTDWAKQGVLLMNTILTVEEHKPLSHQDMGWQNFTNEALKWINENLPKDIYVSVMAQYFPTYKAKNDSLINRKLNKKEYKEVLNYLYSLDLQNGYIQELGNHEEEYVPDFNLTF